MAVCCELKAADVGPYGLKHLQLCNVSAVYYSLLRHQTYPPLLREVRPVQIYIRVVALKRCLVLVGAEDKIALQVLA